MRRILEHNGFQRVRRKGSHVVMINTGDQDMRVGAWWDWVIRLVAIQAVVLVAWMTWSACGEPLWGPLGVGNMFGQWIVVAAVPIALNGIFLRGRKKRASKA